MTRTFSRARAEQYDQDQEGIRIAFLAKGRGVAIDVPWTHYCSEG